LHLNTYVTEMPPRRVALQIPWATLLKIIAAAALVWLWFHLWHIVLLVLVAIIIAVGLAPAVSRLERRGAPRWAGATVVTLLVVGAIVGFLVLTWSSLSDQARNLGGRLGAIEQEIIRYVPQPVIEAMRRNDATPDASMVASYLMALVGSVLNAVTIFVLASILVLYLLIEAERTYAWVRGYVPSRHRARFDRTAREAKDVALGYLVGNVVTSLFAAVYVYVTLTLLGVPASLLLALLAFVADFIPVLGFFLSCVPAIVMAATVSGTMALLMVPIYLFYHLLENYFIGPRVYGDRLSLSKVAVLVAFAIGAELAGIAGALVALPLAAIYPTIEKLWLRPVPREVERERGAIP